MIIDFEITYRGETVNLDETASQMVVSFTIYDGNFPNSSGGGAVDSVNGKTGTVVLNADDIAETSTRKWLTATLKGYYDIAYAWVNTNGATVLQSISDLTTALGDKVDKVTGKGLSENDYTNTEKIKLGGIQDGAEVNVNADWNATSGDAQILNKPTIPDTSNFALKTDVQIVLFKSITQTIVTGKTVENSIYSIPLPIDGNDYEIELYSNANIVTYPGFTQNHRIRCGTYLSPIDGTTGANAIGNQTLIFSNQGATTGAPIYIDRKFVYKGGASGSIFGVQSGATEVYNTNTPNTLISTNFSVQNYLYVTFSAMNSGVLQHNFIIVKLTKI